MTPAETLAFARQLAEFEEHLDWFGRTATIFGPDGEESDLAAWCRSVITDLTAGTDPVTAIANAIAAWRTAEQERSRQQDKHAAAMQADYERRMAEEGISLKVQCPFCGEPPGSSCRTTGGARVRRTDSHRDRWRLARGLPPDGRPASVKTPV